MKRITLTLLLASVLILFNACSQKEEGSKKDDIANPLTNPGGYTQDMINLKENMQQNIQNSNGKENERLTESLNEAPTSPAPAKKPDIPTDLSEKYSGAILKTNFGDIEVKFYAQDAPVTVNNFLNLAKANFYDGTKFHRVIKDFMIQGGDPLSKNDDPSDDGTGGPGYEFTDEINSHKLVRGSLAMANSGPNTNGSQFFIVTADAATWLDGKHTNFGEVVIGLDVMDKIEAIEVGAGDRPVDNVIIEGIKLLEK